MTHKHPDELVAEAAKQPGGWVYELQGNADRNGKVLPAAIRGAWKVDDNGQIVGEFIPNPNFGGDG